MASDISFRGEVNEMSAAYFCREMESLPARSAATIYLHTPGGDIYAGGEMVNALRAALKRGCKVSIEVGSLCASMGAALLAAARASGCRTACHVNSEAMFHGCWTILMGGVDELTDQAKAMRDFNECVKRDLKKCGIADTDEWFAADRQKWLNADELKALGLVDEILEAASDDVDLKQAAVKIAAKLTHKESQMDEPKDEVAETPVEAAPAVEDATEVAENAGNGAETPVEAAAEAQTTEETPAEAKPQEAVPDAPVAEVQIVTDEAFEAKVTAAANQRFAGLQAKHEKMISDLVKERDGALKDLEVAKATATSLQADIEKLEADLAACRDQLTKSEQNRESIVVSALAPAAELPTMIDGLAACKTLAERAAFLNAGNFKH